MVKLIEIVAHPTLVSEIVGQFVFMITMSRPGDSNFEKLHAIDLNDIFKKADNYFVDFTSVEEMIMTEECDLSEKITAFLKEWASITDVTAIQQNIHYNLMIMDKE